MNVKKTFTPSQCMSYVSTTETHKMLFGDLILIYYPKKYKKNAIFFKDEAGGEIE